MRKTKLFPFALTLMGAFTMGCNSREQVKELVTIDVETDYPKKEVKLQDITDTEYIPLETNEEFLVKGTVGDIGEKYIVMCNFFTKDILLFDRASGKGIRKINRSGQGAEEYNAILGVVLDEKNNEIFVFDSSKKSTFVYDLFGEYKRVIENPEKGYYTYSFNYDDNTLIIHNAHDLDNKIQSEFFLISKKNGKILDKVCPGSVGDKTHIFKHGMHAIGSWLHPIAAYQDGWIINQTSSDTIFHYTAAGEEKPIIKRTPSIHSMETEVFLYPLLMTEQCYILQTYIKKFDTKTFQQAPGSKMLMYDQLEKKVFECAIYNGDFSDKRGIFLNRSIGKDILSYSTIESFDLIEAKEKGKIIDQELNELAANLEEDSNPVIMIIKTKE